jgi:hypothetical protein
MTPTGAQRDLGVRAAAKKGAHNCKAPPVRFGTAQHACGTLCSADAAAGRILLACWLYDFCVAAIQYRLKCEPVPHLHLMRPL